jgi:hypothetical protein
MKSGDGIKNSTGTIRMVNTGRATYRDGKLHFDETGWVMIKTVAKRTKKSPEAVVLAALKRAAKAGVFGEKAKDA